MKISHPQFRFVVAGDGPDEAKLKQRAAQRNVDTHLNFVGRTSAPHLYLRAADLFFADLPLGGASIHDCRGLSGRHSGGGDGLLGGCRTH